MVWLTCYPDKQVHVRLGEPDMHGVRIKPCISPKLEQSYYFHQPCFSQLYFVVWSLISYLGKIKVVSINLQEYTIIFHIYHRTGHF